MTASGIPPEFIKRVEKKEIPLSLEEINQAVEYAGIPNLERFEVILLSDIVRRKQFNLSDQIKLLREYLPQSEGPRVIVDALFMFQPWTKEIREIGIDALEKLINGASKANCSGPIFPRGLDFEMAHIISYCFEEDDGSGVNRLLASLSKYKAQPNNSIIELKKITAAIAEIYPIDYLNAASPDPDGLTGFGFGQPPSSFYPLSKISAKTLMEWCSENNERWKRVLRRLEIFILDETRDKGNNTKEKLSPIINEILNTVLNPGFVLEIIIIHTKNTVTEKPVYGDDTFHAAKERRLKILEGLKDHMRKEVRDVISKHFDV